MPRALHKINMRTAVRNILAVFDSATPEQIASGAVWYGEANREARDLSEVTGYPVDVCAAVLSHLSPQTQWVANKAHAWEIMVDGIDYPGGAIRSNVDRARKVFTAYAAGEDVISTFGPKAHKTRRFAEAIRDAGAGTGVVIDVWAARAAFDGLAFKFRDGDSDAHAATLKRVGVYAQLERAYQIAARRRGVSPSACQAIVWTAIRRGGWVE